MYASIVKSSDKHDAKYRVVVQGLFAVSTLLFMELSLPCCLGNENNNFCVIVNFCDCDVLTILMHSLASGCTCSYV